MRRETKTRLKKDDTLQNNEELMQISYIAICYGSTGTAMIRPIETCEDTDDTEHYLPPDEYMEIFETADHLPEDDLWKKFDESEESAVKQRRDEWNTPPKRRGRPYKPISKDKDVIKPRHPCEGHGWHNLGQKSRKRIRRSSLRHMLDMNEARRFHELEIAWLECMERRRWFSDERFDGCMDNLFYEDRLVEHIKQHAQVFARVA